jgi:8-hydroxy-5-deazaflavin:NADPH oxidoreductase
LLISFFFNIKLYELHPVASLCFYLKLIVMRIAILGTGSVGQTLASGLMSVGHQVMVGTRDVEAKLSSTQTDFYGNPPFSEWLGQNKDVVVGTFTEAAASAPIIINATHGGSSINALKMVEPRNLRDKILIDLANPLDFSHGMPPVLLEGLCNTHSLGEEIQNTFPETKVVKTLNTMWSGLMVNPQMIASGRHTNFICGNDAEAKAIVIGLLKEMGWKENHILDLGDISAARGTEAILLIWLKIMNAKHTAAFNLSVVD